MSEKGRFVQFPAVPTGTELKKVRPGIDCGFQRRPESYGVARSFAYLGQAINRCVTTPAKQSFSLSQSPPQAIHPDRSTVMPSQTPTIEPA